MFNRKSIEYKEERSKEKQEEMQEELKKVNIDPVSFVEQTKIWDRLYSPYCKDKQSVYIDVTKDNIENIKNWEITAETLRKDLNSLI